MRLRAWGRTLAIMHPMPPARPPVVLSRCEPAKHLYIALPAYSGEVKVQTTASLFGAGVALALCGIEVTLGYQTGNCYLFHARNQLVTAFMRSAATDLLFWDCDVGAPAEAVIMLARAEKPYIMAAYPTKTDHMAFPITFDADEIWSDADGHVNPYTVPTGFTRINRAVFNAMPWIPYKDDSEIEWMGYFENGIRNGRLSVEDTDFAAKWCAMGGKIHMIPDLTMTHTGSKTWEGNWGRWMKAKVGLHKCGRRYPTTCIHDECRTSGKCRDETTAEAA